MSTLAPARAPGVAAPKPPRAFATAEEQDRERIRAAPLRTRPRPSRLGAGIATLRGAGPRLAEAASELGVDSLGDLLWHVPHGYRDRTTLSEIAELRLGQEATVIGEVRSARLRPTRRRGLTIFEATIADDSGPTKAVWFNQPWLADQLEQGTRVLLHGKLDGAGFKVDAHEAVRSEPGNGRDSPSGLHTTGIVPVHSASARLRPQKIREWAWRARGLTADAIEPLPAALRKRLGLASACDALAAAHFPATAEETELARARLPLEELFLHQAALATRRHEHDSGRRAPALAEQHFQTLERLLAGAGLPSAALLTGSTPAARRRDHLGHLATGQLELVVGTHALIEGDVAFARLALAVVDEQHRFGVRQRAALDAKGPGDAAPHTLHMTATPIPRTLSLTAYGDLDV